jgi:hypothetical protein
MYGSSENSEIEYSRTTFSKVDKQQFLKFIYSFIIARIPD